MSKRQKVETQILDNLDENHYLDENCYTLSTTYQLILPHLYTDIATEVFKFLYGLNTKKRLSSQQAGYLGLIEWIDNVNDGFEGACCSGDMLILNKMIELGVNNFEKGFYNACYCGKISVIDRLLELGCTFDVNIALQMICMAGHYLIIKKIGHLGNANVYKAVIGLMCGGLNNSLYVFPELVAMGLNIHDILLYHSCISGNISEMDDAINLGANDLYGGYLAAYLSNQSNIITKLFQIDIQYVKIIETMENVRTLLSISSYVKAIINL